MRVLNRAFEYPLEPEEHAVAPFAGGIMQHGYQCGMLWGAALAAGAQTYRLLGPGPEAETRAVIASQRLVESFRADTSHINCIDITHIDKSSSTLQMIMFFLVKGGSIGCFRLAARYAQAAFDEINSALSDEHVEVPPTPVSCAAMLAQKMGVSDMHTVMAAGLSGGIGLSGGACGALGAAIWIIGMQIQEEEGVETLLKNKTFSSKFDNLMDRFLKSTDYEFECSKIVGRKFENVSDHAAYLCDGGCSKIIEELAAE
ncbi:C-GCAxxG-C-C family (seleno)protein [Candidatus Neomarinimicrobiota bacterium]